MAGWTSRLLVLVFATVVAFAVGCIDIQITDDGGSTDGQITGSNELLERDFTVDGFNKLDISSAFDATVRAGDAFALVITADDNLIDRIDVEVDGSTLRIGIEPGVTLNRATLRAEIMMPALTEIELSGASHAEVIGFTSTDTIDLVASGASSFDADVDTDQLNLDLSGASRALLRGYAATADLRASGASRMDLFDLQIDDGNVALSGTSTATVTVLEQLDADLSGTSHLEYDGSPQIGDVSTSGGSTITRR